MVASSTTSSSMSLNPSSTSLLRENNSLSTTNGSGAIDCSNNNVLLSKTLPKERYTLVGVDIDTTGRRLIDEIVQLAAFTPNDHFKQYIMPYMNLNPAARQRHQVRVISIGFYRMLKSTQTYKIIKSKSEIAALKDFLDWLEALKARDVNSHGVILLYHEERKFIPYMILEALKKYNLLDRFLNTVKSFANGLNIAKSNSNESLQHYTLRKLSKHLKNSNNNSNIEQNNNIAASSTTSESMLQQKMLQKQKPNIRNHNEERDLFDGNASVRAKLAYEVALHLSNQDSKEPLNSANAIDKMLAALHPFVQPIECDLNELKAQNENLERQNSFRPVFLNYFKSTLYHRVRAVRFRIILAENKYDLQTLKSIWSEKKKDGISEAIQNIDGLKGVEKIELAELFDSFFDPNKTVIKPIVKTNNSRRRNRRVRNLRNNETIEGNEVGAGGDKQQGGVILPDSTTKSPKAQRGKRNLRSYNKNMFRTQAMLPNNQSATTVTNQSNKATPTSVAASAMT